MGEHPVVTRTRNFFEWELRGRGWSSYSYPVELEPPFEPFAGHDRPAVERIDDARRETFLSKLAGSLTGGGEEPAEDLGEEQEELLPEQTLPPDELAEWQILLPPGTRVSPQVVAHWLSTLSPCRRLSFELLGTAGQVRVSLAGRPEDASTALEHLGSLFPEVETREPEQTLRDLWNQPTSGFYTVSEFGLARKFMVPLAEVRSFSPDPLAPIIGTLGGLGVEEVGVVQVLFEATRAPWPASILRSVMTPSGEPFFADAPEITRQAREKIGTPLFATLIRIAVKAPTKGALFDILWRLSGPIQGFGSPDSNEFMEVPVDLDVLEEDLLSRSTHRPGMILSATELLALVHPPSENVEVAALLRAMERTKRRPDDLSEGLLLGENQHRGEHLEVRVRQEARLRHMHLVGASGTGKSTLMVRMILQDIEAGRGVGVLDPHGDLVDEVLSRVPEERLDDVILFDPADPDYLVGWNILAAGSELERELLSSDLVAVFRRLSTSWGDQMTSVLSNAVLAFLHSPRPGTLLDLRRFLVDREFRKEFLESLTDPYLLSWWQTEFPLLAGRKPQAPILTRLDTFLRMRSIREIVTARESLDFRAVVDEGRIFLGKLAQGAIGVENAALLGSLLVSKLHQVTLSRQELREEKRRPFILYLDEFHEVATASMAALFSGVRKYRLGLVVAHQDLYQLHSKAPDVERSVLANAHTRICFRLAESDARQLEKGFSYFQADDLMSLGIGEAICRVGGRDRDFNLATEKLPALREEEARKRRQKIRAYSGRRWGVARDQQAEDQVIPTKESSREPEAATPKAPVKREEAAAKDEPSPEVDLDKETLDYLESLARDPFLSVSERNQTLELSAWRGQRIKSRLLEEGLVREVAINPGGRGERFKLYELTSSGRDLLARYGVKPAVGLGRGGIAHQWWTATIVEYLQSQGLEVAIEDDSRGARVDLAFRADGRDVAVEVELGEAGHAEVNARKNLAAGYDLVVTLLENLEVLPRLKERLSDEAGELPARLIFGALQEHEEILSSLLPSPLRAPKQKQEARRPTRRRRPTKQAADESRPQAVLPEEIPETAALNTPQAAVYVGLSPATLETMRTRGGGPPFSKLGARVVYRRSDLDGWLEERRKRSTSEA